MTTRPHDDSPTPDGVLLHDLNMPVRWGDMDAMGHVNNIMYLQYFEQCRVEWKDKLGYHLDPTKVGMIVKKASATYHRAVTHPAVVNVRMFAGHIGRTSFTQRYELRVVGQGPDLWTEGEFLIVWFDYAAGKPAPIPDELRKLLEGSA